MMSSISSKYFRKHHSLYFATKWALNGFAHCLAKEVNEHNIHVHILCPGMTETIFFDTMGDARIVMNIGMLSQRLMQN